MIDIIAQLGAPGLILMLLVAAVTIYVAAKPFRGRSTWWADVAAVRRWLNRRHVTRELGAPRPLPGFDYPLYRETGLPRSIRWPYNWWRAQLALCWSVRLILGRNIVGLFMATTVIAAGLVSAGLYALMILVALAFGTLPAAAINWCADTMVVARGGTQGQRSSYNPTLTADAVAVHRHLARLNIEQIDRLAVIRAQLPRPTTTAWPTSTPAPHRSATNGHHTAVQYAPHTADVDKATPRPRSRSRIRPVPIMATAALLFAAWNVGDGVMDGLDEDFVRNQAWLAATVIASNLLAWTQLLCLEGDLAKAEPKTLRYRLLHLAPRLATRGRQLHLRIDNTWPWRHQLLTAFQRLRHALA